MIWNNIFYKIKNDLSPFRTAIFAVIVSVVASVCVSAVSETGRQIINNEMDSIGFNGLAAVAYNSNGENTTDVKFYNTVSHLNDVKNVSPVITETTTAVFSNRTSISAMCWGISPQITDVVSLETVSGRMINSNDISSNARVCVVDETVAEAVYKRNNICGKKVFFNLSGIATEFTVIGTVKKNSNVLNSITGDIIPDFIYIPYSTMMNLSSKTSFDQVIFTSQNTQQTNQEFKNRLSDINYRYKNQYINLTNLSKQKEQINKIADTAFFSLFIVSCVAVIVCSLSVASSVNTAVVSRQKDIGIKMSMGASAYNIICEFMISSIISCITGILLAITAIIFVFKIISCIITWHIETDINLIVISIFATILLTTIFSFLPSYKAAKMPPIKALNRE